MCVLLIAIDLEEEYQTIETTIYNAPTAEHAVTTFNSCPFAFMMYRTPPYLHDASVLADEIPPLHARPSGKAPQKNCYLRAGRGYNGSKTCKKEEG